jgi:hypothetical protein
MSTPLDQVLNGLLLDGFGKPLVRPRSVGDPVIDTAISAAQGLSPIPDVDTVAINTVGAVRTDAVPRAEPDTRKHRCV